MRKLLFCFIYFTCLFSTIGQNDYSQWYFGAKAGLSFLTNPPSVLQNSSMAAPEGCVSISDQAGNILFYSRGDSVFNHNHVLMANASGLLGNFSSSQSGLAFLRPGNSQQYYLFTMGLTSSTGLRYSIIDMSLAGGTGSVIIKNVPVYPHLSSEKLAGTKHCNGNDVWVMMHDSLNNFRCYLVTSSGPVTTPTVSTLGSSYFPTNISNIVGCMKFSPSGKKLAVILSAVSSTNPAKLELYDFDNSTGLLSNLITFTSLVTAYDCEFSPDGTKLYAVTSVGSNAKLLQWDLCAGSPASIFASEYSVAVQSIDMKGMQRAINGKIYISVTGQNYLSVINSPNLIGSACNFVSQGQSVVPNACNFGLPNFINTSDKAFVNYIKDLGCNTVTFSPPPTVYSGTAGCSNVVNTITGYQWTLGDPASGAANSSTLASPIHTYPGYGTYTIQLVLTNNSCAPDTIRQTITLNSPTFTVNSASVSCSGLSNATVNLNQGYSSGLTSFTWNPGGMVGSSVNNLSPGIYTITASVDGGSCPLTFTANVLAPQSNVTAIINTTSSCTSSSVTVNVTGGSGNYSYTWMPGGSTVSAISNLSPGNYTLSIYDNINLCNLTQTTLIQTLPVPHMTLTGNFTICAGNTSSLMASGADTYSWSGSSTSASISVSPSSTSVYTVTGTNSVSLCSDTRTVKVSVIPCVGVAEMLLDPVIKLFPNPTSGDLFLETDGEITLIVFTLLGDKIFENHYSPGTNEVDLCEFKNGVYAVQIVHRSGKKYYKIIKEN